MFRFDFAISFAGEDSNAAKDLGTALAAFGASVFIYLDRKDKLLGKRLRDEFQKTFTKQTRFFVPIVSVHYASKDWPLFEYGEALKEKERRKKEFILPIILDDSGLPGVSFVGHIDLRKTPIGEAARLFMAKLQETFPKRAEGIMPTLWVACFGVSVNELLEKEEIEAGAPVDYPSLCDWLEEDLDRKLNSSRIGIFDYPEASARDGEGLSVRIAFLWNPAHGPLDFGELEWWEILEIRPLEEVYVGESVEWASHLRGRVNKSEKPKKRI